MREVLICTINVYDNIDSTGQCSVEGYNDQPLLRSLDATKKGLVPLLFPVRPRTPP